VALYDKQAIPLRIERYHYVADGISKLRQRYKVNSFSAIIATSNHDLLYKMISAEKHSPFNRVMVAALDKKVFLKNEWKSYRRYLKAFPYQKVRVVPALFQLEKYGDFNRVLYLLKQYPTELLSKSQAYEQAWLIAKRDNNIIQYAKLYELAFEEKHIILLKEQMLSLMKNKKPLRQFSSYFQHFQGDKALTAQFRQILLTSYRNQRTFASFMNAYRLSEESQDIIQAYKLA